MDADKNTGATFYFFNEVGIITHLSVNLLAKVLPDGVHPSHFFIVNYLVRKGDRQAPARLAQAMQVTKATMSHSLRILEKRGLVKTAPCEADARSKQVILTKAGRTFQAEATRAATLAFDEILKKDHRRTMAEILPSLRTIRKALLENSEFESEENPPLKLSRVPPRRGSRCSE